MSALTLNLSKPGDVAQKLQLNLKKSEAFKVKLAWEGNTDLDLHALFCINDGSGGKISQLEDILSTYNVKRRLGGQEAGTLTKNPDGTFAIHGGALIHSADVDNGDSSEDEDEWIRVDPSKMTIPPGSAIEIPIIAMIHPQSSGRNFSGVQNAKVSVEDANGTVLMSANLSAQFGQFVGVQMGSIMIEDTGTSFAQVGVGFNEDFNGVLGHFS